MHTSDYRRPDSARVLPHNEKAVHCCWVGEHKSACDTTTAACYVLQVLGATFMHLTSPFTIIIAFKLHTSLAESKFTLSALLHAVFEGELHKGWRQWSSIWATEAGVCPTGRLATQMWGKLCLLSIPVVYLYWYLLPPFVNNLLCSFFAGCVWRVKAVDRQESGQPMGVWREFDWWGSELGHLLIA